MLSTQINCLVVGLLTLTFCSHDRTTSGIDFISGTWGKGSTDGCVNSELLSWKSTITLRREDNLYYYQVSETGYAQLDCAGEAERNILYAGSILLGSETIVDGQIVRKILHSRSGFQVAVSNQEGVQKANDISVLGWQKKEGIRWCSKTSDWVLDEYVKIDELICEGLNQTVYSSVKDLLQISENGQELYFGTISSNSSFYPVEIDRSEAGKWVRMTDPE